MKLNYLLRAALIATMVVPFISFSSSAIAETTASPPAEGEVKAKPSVHSTEELAKAAQNPIADMISLPFQNNTNLDIGPDNQTQNILNIQPVWPFDINEDWVVYMKMNIIRPPGNKLPGYFLSSRWD